MILLFCCDEKNIDYVYLSKSDFRTKNREKLCPAHSTVVNKYLLCKNCKVKVVTYT